MSDKPSIIRQDHEHTVTVSEGTGVATSKPSDPNAPQIRQNLVGEDNTPGGASPDEQPDIPPPASAQTQAEGVVFERTANSAPERNLHAPEDVPAPLAPASGDTETPVDRFLRERRIAVEGAAPADAPVSGPVFERSTQDHFEKLPIPEAGERAPSDGPVFERSLQDHLEPLPVVPGRSGPAPQGPTFERDLSDHRVAVPPAMAQAPREGSSRMPTSVPLEQARQDILEAAQDVQQRVGEKIGAADTEWAEMDFPARVIKLQIENDKVRDRLDELEAMAGPRSTAPTSA
jgi:hypothetical protein